MRALPHKPRHFLSHLVRFLFLLFFSVNIALQISRASLTFHCPNHPYGLPHWTGLALTSQLRKKYNTQSKWELLVDNTVIQYTAAVSKLFPCLLSISCSYHNTLGNVPAGSLYSVSNFYLKDPVKNIKYYFPLHPFQPFFFLGVCVELVISMGAGLEKSFFLLIHYPWKCHMDILNSFLKGMAAATLHNCSDLHLPLLFLVTKRNKWINICLGNFVSFMYMRTHPDIAPHHHLQNLMMFGLSKHSDFIYLGGNPQV